MDYIHRRPEQSNYLSLITISKTKYTDKLNNNSSSQRSSRIVDKGFDLRDRTVIIGTNEEGITQYICGSCNFITKIRLSTSATKEEDNTIPCYHCGHIIQLQKTRRRSRLETASKTKSADTEPLAYSIDAPGLNDVAINKTIDLEWGAKELSRKGTIKFTSYVAGVG